MYYISPKGYYYQTYKNGAKKRISVEKYHKKIKQQGGDIANNSKVALVTLTKNPEDFAIWLNYHLNTIKVDHIFLRVENTPNIKSLINKYTNVSAIYINDVDHQNEYWSLIDKQTNFINDCINSCIDKKIDYIHHIDDDELLMLSDKYNTIQDFFKTIDSKYDNIHFKNVEAVFSRNKKNCFDTTKFLNCSTGKCKSYANGKSSGKISNNLKPHGPHFFRGTTLNVDINDAVILHFDSCNYNKWFDKFKNLSNINEDELNRIPFPYYKDSIKLIQKGINKEDETAKKLYETYKIDPYYGETNYLEYKIKW